MRSYVASAILAAAVVLAPVVAGSAPASSKSPFTITNDPVKDTVVDKVQQKTCTGTAVLNDLGDPGRNSIFGRHIAVKAIFYREPDGKPWVRWWQNGGILVIAPVTELGVSAQWTQGYNPRDHKDPTTTHYAVWPDGDNHFSGATRSPPGRIELTCD